MKPARLRSRLFSAAFIVSLFAAWWFFAPAQLAGSSTYVITKGVSMEPRFHTGDLAIVRPAGSYRVGDIVAYHSTLLHVTVLHRIIGRHGNRYVFKGDNNNFIDPTYPTRSELLGKLWLHIPQGGRVLKFVHSPGTAAALCGLLGVFLLLGAGEKRRRRRRRGDGAKGSGPRRAALMNISPDHGFGRGIDFGAFLTASAVAAAVFLVLGALVFARPAAKATEDAAPYAQQVTFGYSAHAPAGPVYPTGAVRTGDPIFLTLVHEVGVHVDYRFVSTAPHDIVGTEEILLQLTSSTGWSRNFVLTPPTRFTGDHTSTMVTINIPQVQALLGRVSSLTRMVGGSYTIAIVPRVRIAGTVAAHPLNLSFGPADSFQLEGAQLIPQTSSTSSGTASRPTLASARSGVVGIPATEPATIKVLRVSLTVSLLRWISILGLLISAAAATFFYLRKRSEPFEETVQIQSQYGHLIVPIVAGEDLGWPPVDVPNIKALVRLAESGQRLILHNRSNGVDTYLVNDEGTVYRYQVKPSKVAWGDWTDAPVPVERAAA